MFDCHTYAFWYSEKQASLIREHGDDVGVMMINGEPTLWSEARSNPSPYQNGYFEKAGYFFKKNKNPLASDWDDAVSVHKGSIDNVVILVNRHGQLTEEGRYYCQKTGLEATPEALRAAAIKPSKNPSSLEPGIEPQ